MKFCASGQIEYTSVISDHRVIDAADVDEATQKMYDYLEKRVPSGAIKAKVTYIDIIED